MIQKANGTCRVCGDEGVVCSNCVCCVDDCNCGSGLFDADELGLDPETDNTPGDDSRHA